MQEFMWVCPNCYARNPKTIPYITNVVMERVRCDDCAAVSEILVELQPVVTQVKLKCTPIEGASATQ